MTPKPSKENTRPIPIYSRSFILSSRKLNLQPNPFKLFIIFIPSLNLRETTYGTTNYTTTSGHIKLRLQPSSNELLLVITYLYWINVNNIYTRMWSNIECQNQTTILFKSTGGSFNVDQPTRFSNCCDSTLNVFNLQSYASIYMRTHYTSSYVKRIYVKISSSIIIHLMGTKRQMP